MKFSSKPTTLWQTNYVRPSKVKLYLNSILNLKTCEIFQLRSIELRRTLRRKLLNIVLSLSSVIKNNSIIKLLYYTKHSIIRIWYNLFPPVSRQTKVIYDQLSSFGKMNDSSDLAKLQRESKTDSNMGRRTREKKGQNTNLKCKQLSFIIVTEPPTGQSLKYSGFYSRVSIMWTKI